MMLGEYAQLLAAKDTRPDIPHTDIEIARYSISDDRMLEYYGDLYDILGPVIGLRNGFAHWGLKSFGDNFKKLEAACKAVKTIDSGDVVLDQIIHALKSMDFTVIRKGLKAISPETPF